MIDLEKRKRIMQRSIALGHCICNPKQSCPCETFRQKDICPCAGERIEQPVEEVFLTRMVEKAGCASKISQHDLKRVLAGLPEVSHPDLLVGSNTCDDAGVFRLDERTALVQTVDVFMPSVDDPYVFGQIAAANSLSDVYAMGGRPLTALSIIGFPIETVSPGVMTRMLRGGMDKMAEAGAPVVGGHSINDRDPKFGYAVTGLVDPDRIVTNGGASPGDVLVLTKPIGVGIISFAAQCEAASEQAIEAASRSMAELNRAAAEVMVEVGASAATDVTGFGLLGHLAEMASQSGVCAELYADCVPVFDEVYDYVSRGLISGGCERNREFASDRVVFEDGVSEETIYVLCDPQTSGGLLMAVPEDRAADMTRRLAGRSVAGALVGRIVEGQAGRVLVKPSCPAGHAPPAPVVPPSAQSDDVFGGDEPCCCAEGSADTAAPAEERFADFMKAVNADGAVPVRTKELIAVALSVLAKCEPCVKIHINKARAMGIGQAEIDEAVWMAISFGGAPTMMFYDSVMSKQ